MTGVTIGSTHFHWKTLPGGTRDAYGVDWGLTALDGWFDGWEGSGGVDQRAQADGAWVSPQYAGGRIIHVNGTIAAPSWDAATQAWDRLLGDLPFRQLSAMNVSTGDGAVPEMTALIRQHEKPIMSNRFKGRAEVSLSVLAPDPRKYDATSRNASLVLPLLTGGIAPPLTPPITVTGSTSRSQVTLENDGNVLTFPTLVLVGPCPPATIANLTTGEALRIVDAVPADQSLVIDVLNGTATNGGQARRVLGSWWGLVPGVNEVALNADGYDAGAQLMLTYRSAWKKAGVELEWWSVDFKTGQRFGQVQVQSAGKLSRFISMGTDATVSVLTSHDGAPRKGWDEATAPGRMLLVAVDKTEGHIVWGGLVRRRTSSTGPWVQCSLDSIERYFNRRYIGSVLSRVDTDVAQIAADALAPIAADLAPLEVDAKMTGTTISVYHDADMYVRVYSLLEELSADKLAGGIEWTVDLEWSDAARTQMRYVVRIGPRLGRGGDPASLGSDPTGWTPTQWTLGEGGGNCVTGFDFIEDFGEETGANDTVAYSSGEGESKPKSTRYEATDLLGSFARFERRFQPAPSITETSSLDQYAEADHATTRLGYSQIKVTASLANAPRVNLDWWMGDDIDVVLTCERFPRRVGSDGFKEPGFTGRLRTVGWDLDLDARTIVPRIREAG